MMTTCPARRAHDQFRADVLAGLSRPQKRLPSKYFYDAAGSRLFDRITELAEYYPTRTELTIMRAHAGAMAARCGPRCLLIELGAGSLVKARLLIDRLDRPAGYVPVDVSGDHLRGAAKELAADYPGLGVYPVVADFTRPFEVPPVSAARVVYFPGSTIGNFDPSSGRELLRASRVEVGPAVYCCSASICGRAGGAGTAYNDAGRDAAFSEPTGADQPRTRGRLRPDRVRHQAFYNRERSNRNASGADRACGW